MDQRRVNISPELIEDLLNIINNSVIVTDSESRIVTANVRTEKMFSISIDNLRGQLISQLFMPEDVEILVANILSIAKSKGEFEGEAMLRRSDGTVFLAMVAVSLFEWGENMEGMAFTIHDLTELKEVESSLRRSERIAFLGHLIDDLSHQIRNPVTAIGGFARRLDAEECCSPKARAILSESLRLENLLDRLNDFITLRCPESKTFLVGEFIELAKDRLGEVARSRQCRLDVEYDDQLKHELLLVDSHLLLSAFEEIVINSCESYENIDGDRRILFKVELSEDQSLPYVMRIIDHGEGISDEHLTQAFSHFHSNKTKHIGMGLTLAKRIVEEQKGKLTISSEVGKGTTVSCYLLKERRRSIRTKKLDE